VRDIILKRLPPPRLVSNARLFNLDNLGTEVSEELCAIGTGCKAGVFQYLYPF